LLFTYHVSLITGPMTPERWRQIEQIYHCTLEREGSQHSSFLKEACAGDEFY